MSLVGLLLVLIILGFCLWLVNTYVPMAQPIRSIFNLIIVVLVVWWLLEIIGVVHSGPIHIH